VKLPLNEHPGSVTPEQQPRAAASGKTAKRRLRQLPPLVADAKRLSRLLGVGVRSVRTWDYAGKLPRPIKLGARTVWVLSEIRAWLAAGAPDRAEWEARKKHDHR
jgi:predicted DNA-binding transcriptional regulator AlpA